MIDHQRSLRCLHHQRVADRLEPAAEHPRDRLDLTLLRLVLVVLVAIGAAVTTSLALHSEHSTEVVDGGR